MVRYFLRYTQRPALKHTHCDVYYEDVTIYVTLIKGIPHH